MSTNFNWKKYCIVSFLVYVITLEYAQSYMQGSKCYKPIDLLMALDASGSIDPLLWQQEANIAKQLIQAFAIDGSQNKFALLDFSTQPKVRSLLSVDAAKVTSILDGLNQDFRAGQSNIDLALHKAVDLFEAESSSGRSKVLVIITDGFMTPKNGKDNRLYLKPPRDQLFASGSKIFVLGIGTSVDWDILRFIASAPDSSHVFKPEDASALIAQIQNATAVPCQSGGGRADSTLNCGVVQIERIGCFKDKKINPRPLPDLILTDRDRTSSKFSGQVINWAKWDDYLPDLVCRCAKATALKEQRVFGLQFYGECWSSTKTNTYAADGKAEKESNCKTLNYRPCGAASDYCVGEEFHNFVYRITEVRL